MAKIVPAAAGADVQAQNVMHNMQMDSSTRNISDDNGTTESLNHTELSDGAPISATDFGEGNGTARSLSNTEIDDATSFSMTDFDEFDGTAENLSHTEVDEETSISATKVGKGNGRVESFNHAGIDEARSILTTDVSEGNGTLRSFPSLTDMDEATLLSRTLTSSSTLRSDGGFVNPFVGSENTLLDPHSEKFSHEAWIRTLIGITSRDPEHYPRRVAGISYRNLNVHGYGVPTDYQKTFGNYPLEILEKFKSLIGISQKTKIQILRNFDGLVKSGEMLVVLGRPGR
jgi:hypothetical protein